jgi:hypothetical protein
MSNVIMNEYVFDILSVATFHVTAPDYQTARRAAEGVMEFNVRDNTVDESAGIADIIPVASWELTCVAPRGRASLADADNTGENISPDEYQTFAEPIDGSEREGLMEALNEADEALGGDSNDAEHDALYSVRETIAAILGVEYDAPSPDDEDDEDDED